MRCCNVTDRLVVTGSDEQQPAHRMGSLVIKGHQGSWAAKGGRICQCPDSHGNCV